MNWSDVGSAILKFAPLAGEALTSPVGAVVGLGAMIANLFGSEATPEGVMGFIKSNPDRAAERLQFEMANNIEMQKIALDIIKEHHRHAEQMSAIDFQNVDSARKNSPNINASPVDNQIKMRLVNSQIFTLFVCLAATVFAMYWGRAIDPGLLAMLGMIIGSVLKSINEKDGFYWGTSLASQNKDRVIAGKK